MFDENYLHLINLDWTSPRLDWLMSVLSSYDVWLPVVVLAVLYFLIFGGARGRAMVLTAALTLGINDGIFTRYGKKLVDRSRPTEAELGTRRVSLHLKSDKGFGIFSPVEISTTSPEELKPWGGRSFPSGHVTNNISIGLVLVYFLGPWAWLYLIFALGVSYSRIYVGAHWPTDVMLSIVTSTLLTFCVLISVRSAWVRFGPKWCARLFTSTPDLFPPILLRR